MQDMHRYGRVDNTGETERVRTAAELEMLGCACEDKLTKYKGRVQIYEEPFASGFCVVLLMYM